MADLVTIATTAVLSQFLGPSAKHLGEQALERGKQLATKATTLLAQVGREPQTVEPKLLLPLVQAASLETDETLADYWAALLANAADPAQQTATRPGFIEVLRQLTPIEARLIVLIYQHTTVDFTDPTHEFDEGVYTTSFAEQLGISYTQLVVSVDDLFRLRLCEPNEGRHTKMVDPDEQMRAVDAVFLTAFGRAFLAAVTPPTQ